MARSSKNDGKEPGDAKPAKAAFEDPDAARKRPEDPEAPRFGGAPQPDSDKGSGSEADAEAAAADAVRETRGARKADTGAGGPAKPGEAGKAGEKAAGAPAGSGSAARTAASAAATSAPSAAAKPETPASSGPERMAAAERAAEPAPATSPPDAGRDSPGAGRAQEKPPAPPPQPAPRQSGGFWGTVLGGIVAAAIGAAVVWFLVPRDGNDAALADRLTAQEAALADVQATVTQIGEAPDTGIDQASLDALQTELQSQTQGVAETQEGVVTRLDTLDASLAQIEERLASLEARPVPDPQAASARIDSGLDAANQRLEAELAEMRTRLTDEAASAEAEIAAAEKRAAEQQAAAEAASQAAATRAALGEIGAALESGRPYQESLAALATATGETAPSALAEPAESGVPTLAGLQASFPEAARTALAVSTRAQAGGDLLDRVGAFLRVQTGYRSLEPRAGESPDAILSRAEARLQEGDLPAALDAIGGLPPAGQEAMAGWVAKARTRLEALEAADAIGATVAQN